MSSIMMEREINNNKQPKLRKRKTSNLLIRTRNINVPIDNRGLKGAFIPDLMCMTPLTEKNMFNNFERKRHMKVAVLGAEEVGKTAIIDR